jgi:uncharacterized DUF497 family protein
MYVPMYDLTRVGGFDWDAGHSRKSADQHGVTRAEAEQVAFDERLLVLVDGRHSMDEMRYHALGRTDDGRQLQIAFTQRGEGRLIRVISVRDRSRKEGSRYAQEA